MHQAQSEPNTLTSGISMLKKKWILRMSLWNIVQPAICSNGYGLRSWVLIQAVHTTQITGVCCGMRNSPTPPSMTEV